MRPLRYLNKYFLKYKGRLLLGILFVTISNIYAIVPAKMVRITFDFLSDIRSINILFEGSFLQDEFKSEWASVFLLFAGLIIGAMLLKGMFMFFMRMTLVVMSRLIEYDLKNEIYAKYQGLSQAFYKRNNTGDLMARIHEDVSKVRMYIGPAILYAVNLSVLVVLIIGNMLNVSVKLTMFVLIPLPILSFTIFYVSQRINIQSEKVQRQLSALSTFVQEAFSGIRVLKSYSKESQWERKFGIETDKYRQASMQLVKINAIFFPTMIVLIGLSTLLTIYIGGQEVYAGNISTGNIAEFVIYINQLTWPVAAIGWVTSIIQRAAASQTRINEFLEEQTEIELPENTIPEDINGAIKFKSVSLTYPDSGIVALKNINLNVEKGSSLAILGRTGSGKSSIAALITRTYDPTKGAVEIDGMDLRFMDLESMRQNVGYVPQDVFLFSDTISNNISFGLDQQELNDPEITNRIELAADQSDILENIHGFPDGFETYVGERGITLSGGQKQRISIARAIIRNPKILIFDDCLSAVDTETEEKILGHLKQVMEGKTTVIISHRVSSVKHVDRIIVLENGEIEEEGNHDSLMEKKGAYYGIYQKQLLEEGPVAD